MSTTLPIARSESPSVSTTSQERKFRPDIEGLRAVAVTMVLLDHAGLAALAGGYVGVDVFFVLSGFLITGLLLREIERSGSVSLPRFYARRARRLLPAGALVLVTTVLASYYVFGPSRGNRVADDARWSALFASNFRFIQQGTDYLGAQLPPSPLQHFWSLAVEEQFYFVWPVLMILVATVARRVSLRLKLGIVLTVVIVASLAWSSRLTTVDATEAYFSPFPRASELAAGALLAVTAPWFLRIPRQVGIVLSWVGVAIVILTGFIFDAATPFPGTAVAIPVTGAILAVAGGTIAPGGGAESLLRLPPFQWTGKLSYSLYLWHWPILVLAAGWAGHDLTLAQNLGLCVAAVGISAVTYFALEDPIRGSSILARRPPAISVAFGATLIAITLGVASWMLASNQLEGEVISDDAAPIEIPSESQVLSAVAAGVQVTDWPEQPPRIQNLAYEGDCDVTRLDTTAAVCVHGDPTASRTAVVFGDSHGAMWIPAFDQIGKRSGWRIVQLTKPGCPAADFANYSNSLKREYSECGEFRSFALDQIEKIQPDVVIVTTARKGVILAVDGKPTTDGLEEAWSSGLASVLDEIAPNTGRTVLLGDMAYPNEGGIDCLTAHPGDAQACNTPREDGVYADHNAMEKEVAEEHGAEYVDIIPWFCTDTTCPAVIGDLTVRRDAHHVSENYGVWLSGVLGEATGLEQESDTRPASPLIAAPDPHSAHHHPNDPSSRSPGAATQ